MSSHGYGGGGMSSGEESVVREKIGHQSDRVRDRRDIQFFFIELALFWSFLF